MFIADTSKQLACRRDFLKGVACAGAVAALPRMADAEEDEIALWQRETERITPAIYRQYLRDGKTHGFMALENLEAAAEKVLREARDAIVDDVPAVWNVYNMGFIVKTRESIFSIDLVHRRDSEFAPMLDFALITHCHADHWRHGFYRAVDGSGKTVVSNFLDNYGVADWKRNGGFTRARREFRFKDVHVRTSLIDHNDYLVDFTTAFEIRVGDWTLYHAGDSGRGTEPKLETTWGRPDLWLFFPGCGIDTAKALEKVRAKRVVFGHLWELSHKPGHRGRLDEPLIRPRLALAKEAGYTDVQLAFWGNRVS